MYLIDLDKIDKNSLIVYKNDTGKWYEFFDGIAVDIKPIAVSAFLTPEQIERINKQTDLECELEEEKQ